MKQEETSDNMVHLKIRTLFAVVGGLVIGTNVVNSVLHSITENQKTINYNAEAEKRRREHLEEKMDYKLTINDLKEDVEILEEKLEDCKKKPR